LMVLIRSLVGKSIIIFTNTVNDTVRLTLMLRAMSIAAIPLHSKLSQSTRLGSLNKFRAGGRDVLVATDVAARGLDIPQVDFVINYGVPMGSKDYIHRVGRTARAGRDGKAITFVCQYDVEFLLRIEAVVGTKLEEWVIDSAQADGLREKVEDVGREVAREMKDQGWGTKGSGKPGKKSKRGARDDMDRDEDDDQFHGGIATHKSKKRR
jgi:ATP-dependent RNA helicase DDX47/RRP3